MEKKLPIHYFHFPSPLFSKKHLEIWDLHVNAPQFNKFISDSMTYFCENATTKNYLEAIIYCESSPTPN